MKTILLTGATGFLGSALAANLLAEGARVKTLSRNDPAGARVRAAIDQAARGFGLLLEDAHWARLCPVEVDFRNLPGTLAPEVLADVTHVWNAAAEMSYSLKKILQAVEQNVVAASALYGLTAQHAPRCQRFYHVSTAYTAGFGVDEVRETVHLTPKLINAYQLSKWTAETSLLQHHRERHLPVTLFRPSAVIGHQHTGWSTGVSFGLFCLAEGLLHGKRREAAQVWLDLNAQARLNLVCIDTVVRRALALLEARAHRQPEEIFHCVGDDTFAVAEALAPAGALLGLRVGFGPSPLAVDAEIHRLIEKNKPFADVTWHFHADRLKQVLGEAYGPQAMSPDIVHRSLAHFLAHRLQVLAQAPLAAPAARPSAE
ncbi:SDR family oxidoreductase [Stigmatella hybrida]|uniref:SDR family oxidoreductase n=1 Tax=Stigmatella hybrida TaxID=394097 RepID=UPI0021E18FAB|nr:SDR family oxidoreductase [Stigmatella hybrida]